MFFFFRVKLNKYGDDVLATIEEFLNQYPNGSKRNSSSGGSNEQNEAAKKRRGLTATNTSGNGDDFEECSVQSKKRAAKTRNTKQRISDAASMVQDAELGILPRSGAPPCRRYSSSPASPPASSCRPGPPPSTTTLAADDLTAGRCLPGRPPLPLLSLSIGWRRWPWAVDLKINGPGCFPPGLNL